MKKLADIVGIVLTGVVCIPGIAFGLSMFSEKGALGWLGVAGLFALGGYVVIAVRFITGRSSILRTALVVLGVILVLSGAAALFIVALVVLCEIFIGGCFAPYV